MTPENLQQPTVTDAETIRRTEGYQALQAVQRPPWWGVDGDLARRPGVPMARTDRRPMPHARFPPSRQPGEPASPMHGRPNKQRPPVFGTAQPLHGLSGVVKRAAYRMPDHAPSHWLLMLLGDRIESWGVRARKVAPVALGLGAIALLSRRLRR